MAGNGTAVGRGVVAVGNGVAVEFTMAVGLEAGARVGLAEIAKLVGSGCRLISAGVISTVAAGLFDSDDEATEEALQAASSGTINAKRIIR